jgi:hypothetical protein
MKKLTTLLVIMLFSAGITIAQTSEAYIDQSGAGKSDVFLTQSSGAYANIMQSGASATDNLVRGIGQLDAFSNASSLDIEQGSGFGTNAKGNEGNELRVMQFGSGHDLSLHQRNSGFAKVEQRGNNNSVSMSQFNDSHEADIYQSDRGNSVQFRQWKSGPSYADIDQTGRFNSVTGIGGSGNGLQQFGPNELYLNQSGNNNTLELLQDGIDNTMPANVANVGQFTNGNLAQVSQTGGNNNVNLTQ